MKAMPRGHGEKNGGSSQQGTISTILCVNAQHTSLYVKIGILVLILPSPFVLFRYAIANPRLPIVSRAYRNDLSIVGD
jgi:hypothetical protein